MSGLYADTTVTALGGTFTAARELDDPNAHACTGCAGYGRKPLCAQLPACSPNRIIWVAHDDPATITLLATLTLEAS